MHINNAMQDNWCGTNLCGQRSSADVTVVVAAISGDDFYIRSFDPPAI
jgi:hypothetical protein